MPRLICIEGTVCWLGFFRLQHAQVAQAMTAQAAIETGLKSHGFRFGVFPMLGGGLVENLGRLSIQQSMTPARSSCHGLLLARSTMRQLRRKSTYPGCSDFRSHLSILVGLRRSKLVLPLDGNVLSFGELFDAFVPAFSTEAGLFCSAEGCCGV